MKSPPHFYFLVISAICITSGPSIVVVCSEFIWDLYVLGLKSKVFFVKKPDQILKTMDCSLRPNIPKMPLHVSAQFVCSSPKFWDFRKKLSLSVRPCVWVPNVLQMFSLKEEKQMLIMYVTYFLPRTTDTQWNLFSSKFQTFWAWAV